ncbi:MAG: GNAT family N-acetyltransferase [Candidatus Thorarchaeota archaeon]|nr:GNAT family N-acetyltransferase [Candidatus Thorarchaeota archaeon]
MSVIERTIVRFAEPQDLEWCVVEDDSVTEQVTRNKIVNDEIIVGEIDGQLIGYVRLEYLWSKIAYIGMLFVEEAYRRAGVGRKMLNFLENHLKEYGHDVFYSSSQADEPEAQAWHRGNGFTECGMINGLNEGGIGEVFFRKFLA